MNPAYRALKQAWFALKERAFLRRFTSRDERFGQIYRARMWKNPESASGFGSTMAATAQLRAGLADLIQREQVASILDAPCGDFNWQAALDFTGDYTGVDIVPELIAANAADHAAPKRRFMVADLALSPLPQAELVLCRECLNHLPLADGVAALSNLEAAATRFLCITHYPQISKNTDQPASFRYRALNMTLAPFGLRAPDLAIDESISEGGKQIAVWDLANGPARH